MVVRLARDGLADMEPLLRHRGVRTLQNINDLNDTDRAMFLVKSRALYSLYNICLSPVDQSLLRYFGQRLRPIQGWMPNIVVMPMHALAPFRCPNTGLQLEDTRLRRQQSAVFVDAWKVIGETTASQCMQLLRESDDLAEAAKAKAAEALLTLECPYSHEGREKDQHKAVKNNVRDWYMWRSIGLLGGMDLDTSTMYLVWEDTAARLDTNSKDDRAILISNLTNGFKRTKENLLRHLLQTLPYPIRIPKDKDGSKQQQQPAGRPTRRCMLARSAD